LGVLFLLILVKAETVVWYETHVAFKHGTYGSRVVLRHSSEIKILVIIALFGHIVLQSEVASLNTKRHKLIMDLKKYCMGESLEIKR
jgi:hypothetical protein